MDKLTVFLGARTGASTRYTDLTETVADTLVAHNITLVYGGSGVGLMDKLAERVLARDGKVIGVTTEALFKQEPPKNNLSELHIVDSMAQRKRMLMTVSDGMIILPGGVGTMEEFFEAWSSSTLGAHSKPIGILNTFQFYDKFLDSLVHLHAEGFVSDAQMQLLHVADDIETLINHLQTRQSMPY